MSAASEPLRGILRLNTQLFLNSLDGVSDELALTRPNATTNHMSFIACHLVDARHYLAKFMGCELETPFSELPGDAKGIDDIEVFPSLDRIRTSWKEVSTALEDRLSELDDRDMESEPGPSFPIEQGETLGGAITFLLEHDSFHLGQLAFLRRYFGLEAMKYA